MPGMIVGLAAILAALLVSASGCTYHDRHDYGDRGPHGAYAAYDDDRHDYRHRRHWHRKHERCRREVSRPSEAKREHYARRDRPCPRGGTRQPKTSKR
jgi:hypothetical protein